MDRILPDQLSPKAGPRLQIVRAEQAGQNATPQPTCSGVTRGNALTGTVASSSRSAFESLGSASAGSGLWPTTTSDWFDPGHVRYSRPCRHALLLRLSPSPFRRTPTNGFQRREDRRTRDLRKCRASSSASWGHLIDEGKLCGKSGCTLRDIDPPGFLTGPR